MTPSNKTKRARKKAHSNSSLHPLQRNRTRGESGEGWGWVEAATWVATMGATWGGARKRLGARTMAMACADILVTDSLAATRQATSTIHLRPKSAPKPHSPKTSRRQICRVASKSWQIGKGTFASRRIRRKGRGRERDRNTKLRFSPPPPSFLPRTRISVRLAHPPEQLGCPCRHRVDDRQR